MEILKAHLTKNDCYKKASKASHVGILVHSTGAVNKNLKRYVDSPDRLGVNQYNNTWNRSGTDKCVHAFIGYDKNQKVIVAETLPLDYACWGSGKGKNGSYNYNPTAHIQFEICQGSDTDETYYKQAIAVAEEYCAYLCKQRGWSAKNITSHREAAEAGYASNHGDPCSWMKCFGDSMDKFRDRVAKRLGEGKVEATTTTSTPKVETGYRTYTVQRGESLWTIARDELGKGKRYREIMELNGLKSDLILAGQKIKLPVK